MPSLTGRSRLLTALALLLGAPALRAQVTGSVGLAGTLVEYDGFLSSTAGVLSPVLRFDGPNHSIAAQGNWTFFESGTRVLQGNLAAALLLGHRSWWRVELSGSAGASQYASDPWANHLLGGVRFHAFGRSSGGWIGGSLGRTRTGAVDHPVEISAAGWTVRNKVALVVSATGSGIDGDHYLDLVGAVRWTRDGLELEGRLGARPWSESRGRVGDPVTGTFAEGSVRVPVGERISLSLNAGTYPTDPIRRVLGSKYLSAGVRLLAFGRSEATNPVFDDAVLRSRRIPEGAGPARLELASHGETRRLRIVAPGAETVELMADFTDWEPIRMDRTGRGVWEITLPVPAGVHRLNVRLDGGPWVAPKGTRAESTEFDGEVGIVVLP